MAEIGTHDNKITPQQQKAIAALLSTNTVTQAATVARVGERTLFRWLTEPDFKAALSVAEGELIAAATRRLLQYQDSAISVIVMIMADKQYSASVRLRAAIVVIDTMLRLRELNTIEVRLAALEANIAKQN